MTLPPSTTTDASDTTTRRPAAPASPSRHRMPTTGHVDPRFLRRWSPRAFTKRPVPRAHVRALFEAARWAPSSYNEQPWRFVYATREADRATFLETLFEGNRAWAENAPVLAFVLAKRTLTRNGKPNRHAWFDAGAAWMSLALQAGELGLHAHAMGGFDADAARRVLGAPADHDVVCALAIGYRGAASTLPDWMAKHETPSDRKPLADVAFEGRYGGRAE